MSNTIQVTVYAVFVSMLILIASVDSASVRQDVVSDAQNVIVIAYNTHSTEFWYNDELVGILYDHDLGADFYNLADSNEAHNYASIIDAENIYDLLTDLPTVYLGG